MLGEIVGAPEQHIRLMRSLPAWAGTNGRGAHDPREVYAVDTYRMDPARMAEIQVPTLLLLGGESPLFFRAAHKAIPRSRLGVLPGQQHVAMDTAPDLFVREVLAFLDANE